MRTIMMLSAALLGYSVLPAMAAADHGVSWYVSHPQELQATMSACTDDPGHLATTPDCKNAEQAQADITASYL